MIRIFSQEELDKIPEDYDKQIQISFDRAIITKKYSFPIIISGAKDVEVQKRASVILVNGASACLYNKAFAKVYDHCKIETWDKSAAIFYDDAEGEAHNFSTIILHDNSQCQAYDSVILKLYDNSRGKLFMSATGMAHDKTKIEAAENCLVTLYGLLMVS